MTNWEKYKDEIMLQDKNTALHEWSCVNIKGYADINTFYLRAKFFADWCNEEYTEQDESVDETDIGKVIEVRDEEDSKWKERDLLAILPDDISCRYITRGINSALNVSFGWKYARRIKE